MVLLLVNLKRDVRAIVSQELVIVVEIHQCEWKAWILFLLVKYIGRIGRELVEDVHHTITGWLVTEADSLNVGSRGGVIHSQRKMNLEVPIPNSSTAENLQHEPLGGGRGNNAVFFQ